jgi:hypothetical protein
MLDSRQCTTSRAAGCGGHEGLSPASSINIPGLATIRVSDRLCTRAVSGPDTYISEVYTWYIPGIYFMPAFNTRNQCLFLAIYASCILLFAGIMSSAQNGDADPPGMTKTERFVCTSCEQRNLPAFFLTKRSCKIHMSIHKRCSGALV